MGTVWVFQHLEEETPELIGRVLEAEGHELRIFRSDRQQLPPAIEPSCHGLVVLGGAMGVHEADRHPWIIPEIELIRGALAQRLPLMAMCMGSQLLATAAGARVYPGDRPKEIGWDMVRLTEAGTADALCRHLPDAPGSEESTIFQWHGDTFDLPPGAELLASSELYPHQVFRLGKSAYGFQFHFEISAETISRWLETWPEAVRAGGVDAEAVKAQTKMHIESLARRGRALISQFSTLVRAGEATGAKAQAQASAIG